MIMNPLTCVAGFTGFASSFLVHNTVVAFDLVHSNAVAFDVIMHTNFLSALYK
jgi:hypothetical protein